MGEQRGDGNTLERRLIPDAVVDMGRQQGRQFDMPVVQSQQFAPQVMRLLDEHGIKVVKMRQDEIFGRILPMT